jgi:hypothetical protein
VADLRNTLIWALGFKFSAQEYDYATILALKILNKKCKMNEEEQTLFMAVYDGMGLQENSPLVTNMHQTIAKAREANPLEPAPEYEAAIHQLYSDAAATMEKPKMKAYKAFVRSFLGESGECGCNSSRKD